MDYFAGFLSRVVYSRGQKLSGNPRHYSRVVYSERASGAGVKRSKYTMKPLGVPLMMLTLSLCVAAHSETEGETLFVERGYRGIVPCNPAASLEYTFDDLEGVFWYFGQYDRDHFIFSYFQGALYQGVGIPERTYSISSNFGLIIQNVTDSDEGRYYYKVEPKEGRIYKGSKKVAVKVTSKQLFPVVPECDPRLSKPVDTCIVRVPHDVVTISLTCKVEHVKPAVDILWFHVLPDGGAEQVNSSTTILPVTRPGSSFDNTYTSLLTLHLPTMGDDIMKYRCEAHGVAVGSENGSHLLVSVRKISPKVHADRVVFLERGRRGIVSYFLDSPIANTTEDLDCVFWYFGSREHAIGCYSHDTISPQNGICLGCNNISSNLALVIQNVTDSDEGTYFYTVVPKVGRLHEGTVEVAVKVSAKKPFPVVPGCVPQQSELSDECIISVPHDMVNVTLTCKVEQVKPPVAIRWSIVFQDGCVEEAESTHTWHLKNAHWPGSFDNTYTTVSSLYLSTTGDDSMRYRCEAHGVAVDREDRSQINVIVRRDSGMVQAVSAKKPFPVVPGCVPQQSELSDECIISVPHDMVNVTLTCKVEQVKSPVAIRWSIVFQDGRVEEAESTHTRYLTEVHQPGSFDNTYTTVSSLYLSTTADDSMRYRCEAHGVAVDRENRSQINVIVRRDSGMVQAETTRTTNPGLQNNPFFFTTVVVTITQLSIGIYLTLRFLQRRLGKKT